MSKQTRSNERLLSGRANTIGKRVSTSRHSHDATSILSPSPVLAQALERWEILIRNGDVLSHPRFFAAPAFVSPHPSTPISESRYTGMTPDEALVSACEGPIEPDELIELDTAEVCEGERCYLASKGMHVCRRIATARTENTDRMTGRQAGVKRSAEDAHVETIHSTEVGRVGRTSEDASRPDRVEPWQVTLNVWRAHKEHLRALWLPSGDPKVEDDLKAWGGMTTDYAHEYRVEQALKQGKAVPREVLADYPGLASRYLRSGQESREARRHNDG